MGINRLSSLMPEHSVTERLRAIERQINEFKSSPQTPTVRYTEISEATGQGEDIILATVFAHPIEKLLMAVPEVNIRLTDFDDDPNIPQEQWIFPEGTAIQGLIPVGSVEYLQFIWWFDFESSFFSGNNDLTAYLRFKADGAMWNTNAGGYLWQGSTFSVRVRWRYLLVGDEV